MLPNTQPTPPYSNLPHEGERQIEVEEGEITLLNAPQRSPTLPLPIPTNSMSYIPPPHCNTKDIHVMAMWSVSHISRHLGLEEWSVFSISDPIRLETAHDGNDPNQLRYGDVFVMRIYNENGDRQTYLKLRVLSFMEPDSPFFMLFRTWSSRNCEMILRVPTGFITTTVDTLLRHIDRTTGMIPGIEVFPTVIFTDAETRARNTGRRFLSHTSRTDLDPEGIMDQYILLVQE